MATFNVSLSVDEIVDELSSSERQKAFDKLADVLKSDAEAKVSMFEHELEIKKKGMFLDYFRELSDFDKRKLLADALYVSSYYDDDALKLALEPILTAR